MSDEEKELDRWDVEAVKLRILLALRDLTAEELLEKYIDEVWSAGFERKAIPADTKALGQEILRRMRFAT